MGWPWGQPSFEGSAASIKDARRHFEEAGLCGFEPENGRMKFKEALLRKAEATVNTSQREAQRHRVPVQKLLEQYKSSVEAYRLASIKVFRVW